VLAQGVVVTGCDEWSRRCRVTPLEFEVLPLPEDILNLTLTRRRVFARYYSAIGFLRTLEWMKDIAEMIG
jgi:hypothetical protein